MMRLVHLRVALFSPDANNAKGKLAPSIQGIAGDMAFLTGAPPMSQACALSCLWLDGSRPA